MMASDAEDAASVSESVRDDSLPMTAELATEEALETDSATLLVTLSTAGCSLPMMASEALLATLSAEPVDEPRTASDALEADSDAACAAAAMLCSILR